DVCSSDLVGEQGRQDFLNLFSGEWGDFQLGAVELLRGVSLAGEGRMEGARRQAGEQRLGRNVHGGELGVGQETGAVVEDRAVVVDAALLQHGDVVEMAVVVEKQGVHLEKQGEILGELGQACELGGGFGQVGDAL